jgi:hypothetical protein
LRAVDIDVSFKTGHGHVRLIRISRHTATKNGPIAPIATKEPASGGHGGDGGGNFLIPTLDEKKREEREERDRGGKGRKLPPPQPPQPHGSGLVVAMVAKGGDRGAMAGDFEPGPSLSLAGFKEIFDRRGLEEITAPILAKDQGIAPPAAKTQLDRAVRAYGLTKRRLGLDDYYRLPGEVVG